MTFIGSSHQMYRTLYREMYLQKGVLPCRDQTRIVDPEYQLFTYYFNVKTEVFRGVGKRPR